jgi:MoaA/NifB/PqqE/SkfB family radical SAM enzyme
MLAHWHDGPQSAEFGANLSAQAAASMTAPTASSYPTTPSLRSLPLVTLYLTERCNSRCISCDYWQHGRADMTPEFVSRLLPSLAQLGTRTILISGGEPLIHPQWALIAEQLRASGLRLWLLTSGLSLAKHAVRAAQLFESITVSLDGSNRNTYAAIRGLDAFDKVCAGIRATAEAGVTPSVRVTVQRANYREMAGFVELARRSGARQVSFLAADVSNPHAFGRMAGFAADVALGPLDLPHLERILATMERAHAKDFLSGFIAESPQKLRRILQYYAAICGVGAYPPTRCNAPEFSAVIAADGHVNPCFFIPGPATAQVDGGLVTALNSEPMAALRTDIRERRRPECTRCVCSMWRDLDPAAAPDWSPAALTRPPHTRAALTLPLSDGL